MTSTFLRRFSDFNTTLLLNSKIVNDIFENEDNVLGSKISCKILSWKKPFEDI